MKTLDNFHNNQPDKCLLKQIRRVQNSERAKMIFDLYNKKVPELVNDLLNEKNLKNEAYFFLIEMGLMEQFEAYCKRISKEG